MHEKTPCLSHDQRTRHPWRRPCPGCLSRETPQRGHRLRARGHGRHQRAHAGAQAGKDTRPAPGHHQQGRRRGRARAEHGPERQPDGYTISAPSTPAFTATIFLKGKPYDLDDMAFAAGYMVNDRILLVKPDKPYKTWQEFIAYVKANPGKVSIGSGASQAAMEVLRSIAIKEGLDVNFVMYKSGGEASADLIGGHIDACELGVGTAAYQAARKGELSVLANLGTGEVPDFPGVPK
ncbi:MAG: hypothetical protein J6P53_06465, partial [Mailhella sp.]|nr:hypothetical protein [Mailhella sp.]